MIAGLVTVVVPVYNVEKYLDRCVSSIVEQTYRNLEIILVDDGSPDNCPKLCDAWAKRENRIKVIHKQNEGLGFARNTGMDNAHGEYICFFDSDDYIEPDTIEACMQVAQKESADIVSFGNDRVTQSGVVIDKRIPTPPKPVFSGEEVVRALLPRALSHNPQTGENWNLSLSGCFSLFSMDLIEKHHWRFVSEREIICEDFYSVLALFAKANKIAIINRVFYHYMMNFASLSHTHRDDRYERIKLFYRQLMILCDDLNITEYVSLEAAALFAGLSLSCFKRLVASEARISTKMTKIKNIVCDPYLQGVLRDYDFSGDNRGKKMFWYAIRKKYVRMCYFLVQLRNFKDKINECCIKI